MHHPTFQQEPEIIAPNEASNAEAGIDQSFQQHIQSQLNTPTTGNSSPRKLSTSVAKSEALLTDEIIHNKLLSTIRTKKGYIIDMDGVIYHVSILGLVFSWVSVCVFISINFPFFTISIYRVASFFLVPKNLSSS
jgi:hypothetical protein